jgi:hypothetical protein
VVGEPQAELAVGTGHVGRVRVSRVSGDVGAPFDQLLDLLTGQGGLAGGLAAFGLGLEALSLGVGDPPADLLRIAASV